MIPPEVAKLQSLLLSLGITTSETQAAGWAFAIWEGLADAGYTIVEDDGDPRTPEYGVAP